MKTFKNITLAVTLILCCSTNLQAQHREVDAPPGGAHGIPISFGGGYVTPSNAVKSNAFAVNTPSISADVFFPIMNLRKGWDGVIKSVGLNVNATYLTGGSGNPTTPLPAGFAVTGATSSRIAYKGTDPRNPGFIIAAGPQLNIGLGNHFLVSPILSVGYTSITQKTLSFVQTTSSNGKDYDFNLTTLPENKISGFTFNPALRLQYIISPSFGLWFQGCYIIGPTAKTTTTSLIPNGPAQTPGNTYNLQQLQTATYRTNETVNTKYNAVRFGGGVVFCFGRKGWDGHVKGRTAGDVRTYTGGRKNEATATVDKGWDGTVKSLFEGSYESKLVSKVGGVEKLIEQINKLGKGKATLETYGGKQFIKVATTKDGKPISDFYPIGIPIEQAIPIGSGVGSGGLRCSPDATCYNCQPTPSLGGGFHCACIDDSGPCTSIPGLVLSSYTASSIDKNLLLTLENNETTLSGGSIKNMSDLVITQFEHATKIKTALKKEGNLTYTETQFTAKGKDFVMIGKLNKNVLIDKFVMFCNGTCNGIPTLCKLFFDYSGGRKYTCNCNTGCKLEIIGFPIPAEPVRNVGESMEGLLFGEL